MPIRSKRLLVISDLHCGHLLGLTPPEYMREDWKPLSMPFWNFFEKTIKEIGPVDYLVINGDMVDGEGKKETIGHLTTDTKKQIDIAAACVDRITRKKTFLTYGTPFHTVGSYSYEEGVSDAIHGIIKDELRIKINGWHLNFRHVIGRSDTPYGQPTQIYKEVVRELIKAMLEDYKAADYIFRSHVHYHFIAGRPGKMGIITPCLQLPDGIFGRKMRAQYYDVGMLLVDITEIVDIKPILMPLKMVKAQEYICL